jgi:transcriptional regulator with XRE-family HTH domain
MSDLDPEKVELGKRLAEARDLAGLTQPTVAVLLTNAGIPTQGKGTVSAWEKGRNVPDALVLKHLSRLYDASADALLGLPAASAEAERLAILFDSMDDEAKVGFMKVCGPYLDKYARVNDLDELFTDEDQTHVSKVVARTRPAPKRRKAA